MDDRDDDGTGGDTGCVSVGVGSVGGGGDSCGMIARTFDWCRPYCAFTLPQ